MPHPVIEYSDFEEFSREFGSENEAAVRMLWQLLGELDEDEVLIRLPAWLAEEKTGYVEGSTPTAFVGRIGTETEKAIRFDDAVAAEPLMRLAHRIVQLEEGVESADEGDDRREWLDRRLREKRREFEERGEMVGLREPWLPKSQISNAIQRRN